MKIINCLFLLISVLAIISCETEEPGEIKDENYTISGQIQKGPFINGTSLMVSELNSTLNPTGKVFNTQIVDNKGSFKVSNISLSSQYVELIANGFYFNENSGRVSSSQLTLHALSDLTDSSTINVNILTELEKGRVEQLVSEGKDFKASKHQAQKEILRMFEVTGPDLQSSEYLDITKKGEENAILLAISVIVQGLRTESELSELIAAIRTDIKEDGVLDNQQLGQRLISDVKLMNLADVRENIISRYVDLGATIEIPDFEKYIHHFIENTDFVATSGIAYAAGGKYGSNLLSLDRYDYTSGTPSDFSISAEMSRGTSLKVIVYPDYINDTTIIAEPKNIIVRGHYADLGYAFHDNSGWRYDNSGFSKDRSMILYSTESDRVIECEAKIYTHGRARIEIYENGQATPTRVKRIRW